MHTAPQPSRMCVIHANNLVLRLNLDNQCLIGIERIDNDIRSQPMTPYCNDCDHRRGENWGELGEY